jgi:hypothetical protein
VSFCKGPNKKPKGFAKQKQPAIFAMRHASQLVQHHPSQHFCDIYHKQNFVTRSVSVHPSDIPHFTTFNHTQNIAHFTIHKVSLQTLKVTRHHKLALFDTSHFAFEYISQTSSQIFTKLSGGVRIASCDVR